MSTEASGPVLDNKQEQLLERRRVLGPLLSVRIEERVNIAAALEQAHVSLVDCTVPVLLWQVRTAAGQEYRQVLPAVNTLKESGMKLVEWCMKGF